MTCRSYHALGAIYHSKGETDKGIHHFEAALTIASSLNLHDEQFWIHYALVQLFLNQGKLDEAHAHIERAKPHTVNNTYLLGRVMQLQAVFLSQQHRLKEAKAIALEATNIYEKLGVMKDLEKCQEFLQQIEAKMNLAIS